MPYYHICSTCGATLDPGEKCDCYPHEALMADVLTLTPDERRMLLEYIDTMIAQRKAPLCPRRPKHDTESLTTTQRREVGMLIVPASRR